MRCWPLLSLTFLFFFRSLLFTHYRDNHEAYFLWAFQRVFFGELNEKYKNMPEINGLELFTVIPLAIITLFFGIYPGPYLDIIKATMDQIIEKIAFVATYASM